MLEYFDAPSLDLLRARFPEIPAAARAAILFEQELGIGRRSRSGPLAGPHRTAGALADESWFALTARDRERFRRFRHSLPELVNDTVRRAGAHEDEYGFRRAAGAQSRDAGLLPHAAWKQEFPGRYVIFGHIGDAHVHVNIFSDPADPKHATGLLLEFARHAVALGGTVSAEHGLGKRKAHLLELQYAPEHLEAMRAVKRRLDPQGILGRGTLTL